jgi:uncharacterized protein (UPF0333 family)
MNKKFVFLQKNEKGVSLIFTLLFLTTLLAAGLGMANLMLKEIKISSNIGHSVPAYYAAEAGIEKTLYTARKGDGISHPYQNNEAVFSNCSFSVQSTQEGIPPGIPWIIKSVGTFQGVKRGVEIEY